ncbi:glucosyltransferase [Kappamyces sp. JEL0829]|nr:glucosyltransferase [Kappamyces sp. JEL0829]
MDEVFHYNQTLKYHGGTFDWDPKITTPPGLYVLYLLPHVNLWICRAFNLAAGLVQGTVLRRFHSSGWTLFFFPPSFFFHFLFYTDTWSTLFVMEGLYYAKQQRYNVSALWCLASLTLRQTNAVWVAFIAGTSLLDVLATPALCVSLDEIAGPRHLLSVLWGFLWTCLRKLNVVLKRLWPYCVLLALFAGFVVWNGGIALGDKSNHQMSLHFPQLLYFAAFSCFFGLFGLGGPLRVLGAIPGLVQKHWLALAVLVPVAYILVANYTIAHPFLLADNRHYTFYIWRYFLAKEPLRAALCPVYAVAALVLVSSISHQPVLWILIYVLATVLTLVPSPLIEFRYYIIPFYILRLNMRPGYATAMNRRLELVFYLAINAFTFYMFLCRPFTWASEPWALQRFMW